MDRRISDVLLVSKLNNDRTAVVNAYEQKVENTLEEKEIKIQLLIIVNALPNIEHCE